MNEPSTLHKAMLPRLAFIRHKKQEYFVCFSLDSNNKIITRRVVTIGLLDVALVHPREVFAGPLKDRAASVVVAHNHPSGDPQPSAADIEATRQLTEAGELLGIPLSEHLIVAKGKFYSFRVNHQIEHYT